MSTANTHYATSDIEQRILAALQEAGFEISQPLLPLELAALDHFHTGGLESSLVLQELTQVQKQDRVLDIGAGLAGPARMLAATEGCRVDCIDMSPDFCAGAELLNRLTGLEELVKVFEGSALASPFEDNTFDVAWMQNVGMNIEDKRGLYSEIRRVLKPGGRFAFQEMTAGHIEPTYFPLPWTGDSDGHFLIGATELQDLLGECGFVAEYFEDVSDSQFAPPKPGSPANTTQRQLSLSTYVDDLATKGKNAQQSLKEEQIRFYRGVFRAV